MTPTLKPNQLFIMHRRFGNSYQPRNGDVVVFKHEGEILVKRVWAKSGDSIWITKGRNGNSLVPDSDVEKWRHAEKRFPGLGRLKKMQIAPGKIFVLGDNYAASSDSRDFGPVDAKSIIGYAYIPRNDLSMAKYVAYAMSPPPKPSQLNMPTTDE